MCEDLAPPDIARSSSGGSNVTLERVIHHHAVGVESPAESPDRTLHALDPFARQTVGIASIVERDNLFEQHAKQILAIARVMNSRVRMRAAFADAESVQSVECLSPPPVEYGKIQAAIKNDFLPAGAGSFQRSSGCVQPHIDALHQM